MKVLYKITMTVLIGFAFASFAVGISMYYWPGIPAAADASKGRVYVLNNHGRYTYMNRKEYLLNESLFGMSVVCFAGAFIIDRFLDPFDRKLRPRPLDPKLPPWRNGA